MAGIDEQLRMREMAIAGNPQAAQQKYAQSKDLMDLLVAQKVSNDYTTARNAMQANAQAPAGTVKDQLNMSNTQVTKNDMMRSLMPGVAIKAGRDQQAMQRQSMGIPSQPAPNQQAMRRRSMGIPSQPAPNIRMADGGIVGYAPGGGVKDLEKQLEKIARIEEGRFYQPRTGRNGAGEQVETDKNYVVPDAEYGGGTYASAGPRTMLMNLISGNKGQMRQSEYDAILEQLATLQAQEAQKTRKAAIEQDIRRQERQPAFFNKGGIVGYQQGGNVIGYNSRGSVDLLGAALEAEGITDPATIALIRSIYAQESSSGQDARVSPAGARGGMQVMPATFREMMGPDADIDDPITNLRAGSRYAQQMLTRAKGDPRLAAAGYYGGPGGMDRLRTGNDVKAPQDGFPSVAEYADQVVNRADSAERPVENNPTGRLGDYTGNLEAAGIDPDFFQSTYREGAGKGTQPEVTKDQTEGAIDEAYLERTGRRRGRPIFKPAIDAVSSFLDTMTTPPEYVINEAGYRVPNPTILRSGEEVGETVGDYNARRAEIKEEIPGLPVSEQAVLAGQELSTEEKRSREGAPLGNRVPSKDAGKAVGGDPFNVQGMVDRLVEPEFRTQGIIRDAEPTNRQKFAKAFNLPLKDFEKPPAPPEKKGIFDNVDMGRLQAFLAGGGGQTTTAGALGGGLKGLMGEDQRREAIASKEAIEAAKISSQRYGVQQDFDAAMAKIGAENRRAVFKAQRDALEAYEGDKRELAADALFDITNGRDEQFNQELMLLRETYDKNPKVLTSKIAALTNETLDDRMRSVAGATGGSNSGVFEVELPAGG